MAGTGVCFLWFGSYARNPRNFMYWNWKGQPVYPSSVVPIGAVLIVLSLIPVSWIEAAVEWLAR